MDPTPLADRSTNTHLAQHARDEQKAEDLKTAPASMSSSLDYHRQVLQGKLENGGKNQTSYVSPSDDIMSPCSKKLSDLKGKRFKNAGKPPSLAAKLGKKSFEQSSSSSSSPTGKQEGQGQAEETSA
ncbi:Spo12 family [Aspergillus sp. HF37]|nr:Spo12 family [Aspergillus sp. HF37]